ncbi:hypothetical protein [Streptomyces sp. NRRL F-5126]|uniref:hypothetical protein n=1 Tax=Streptomyces sp. NRRL F-5126 TaxID=1463857 RepID=UPI00131E2E77|nr:hypothetical protein [Streptomyces sp. NRRL F-5126]
MHLSFSVPSQESPWIKTWESIQPQNAAEVSEMDLRYKYFGVAVEMSAGGVDFISKNKYVTLMDLGLSFRDVIAKVSAGRDAAFGFTESEEVIRVRHVGEYVSISSSNSSAQASVSRSDFVAHLSSFVRRARNVLLREVPELGNNPVLQRMLVSP